MDNKLECSLCLENFKDPRILACIHTFCRDCLETYVSKAIVKPIPGSQFMCPLCRAKHVLPKEGVNGLQKNFYLDKPVVKDIEHSHPVCAVHSKEDLRFYCRSCKESICRDCKVVSHEGHSTGMVDDVVKEIREKLEKVLNDIEVNVNENEIKLRTAIETEVNCLETTLLFIKENTEQMKKDIDGIFAAMTRLIQPHINKKKRKVFTIQAQSGDRLDELGAYKEILSEATDKNDHNTVFNLFQELIEYQDEIERLKESPSLSSPGPSKEEEFDGKRLKSIFFEFRDTVEHGLVELKKNDILSRHGGLYMEGINTFRLQDPNDQATQVRLKQTDEETKRHLEATTDVQKPPKKKAKKTPKEKETKPQKKANPKRKKEEASYISIMSDSDEDSDDDPLVKKTGPPTNDELKVLIKKMLYSANLEDVTMNTVLKDIYAKYPNHDLSDRKEFIKNTVKQVIMKFGRKPQTFCGQVPQTFCGQVKYSRGLGVGDSCPKWWTGSIVLTQRDNGWELVVCLGVSENAALTVLLTQESLRSCVCTDWLLIKAFHPPKSKDQVIVHFKPDNRSMLKTLKDLCQDIKGRVIHTPAPGIRSEVDLSNFNSVTTPSRKALFSSVGNTSENARTEVKTENRYVNLHKH